MAYKLKQIPSDFLVSESLILPREYINIDSINTKFDYYRLTKCGYTTFTVIETIASECKINAKDIGYAGLKDEDGLTDQYISIPDKSIQTHLEEINNSLFIEHNKFIQLTHYGKGGKPIAIGDLCGNTFQVTIRNLPFEVANKIYEHKYYSVCFINYYGLQRFGLPNAKKDTHLIGQHFLQSDYTTALELLKKQPSNQGEQARQHIGDAKLFFARLDPRIEAFYRNSFHSFKWNEEIKKYLIEICSSEYIEKNEGDISYIYPLQRKANIDMLQNYPELQYLKVRVKGEQLVNIHSNRQTIIQANLSCLDISADECNKDAYCCKIMFFLPSGCYATIFIEQLLDEIVTQ